MFGGPAKFPFHNISDKQNCYFLALNVLKVLIFDIRKFYAIKCRIPIKLNIHSTRRIFSFNLRFILQENAIKHTIHVAFKFKGKKENAKACLYVMLEIFTIRGVHS